ncbi:pseudoazurin [soil metagenome]
MSKTIATLMMAGALVSGTLVATGVALSSPVAAKGPVAKTITVQMKDIGPDGAMAFVPGFITANPGDTVHFVPASPSHNAETIASMLPAGVTPSKGMIGKPFDLVVTAPGVYGIKCTPHYSMGMVARVQVGKGPSANLAAARAAKLPPFAQKRMALYLAKAQ